MRIELLDKNAWYTRYAMHHKTWARLAVILVSLNCQQKLSHEKVSEKFSEKENLFRILFLGDYYLNPFYFLCLAQSIEDCFGSSRRKLLELIPVSRHLVYCISCHSHNFYSSNTPEAFAVCF